MAASVLRQPDAGRIRAYFPFSRLHANARYWPRLVYQASAYPATDLPPGEAFEPMFEVRDGSNVAFEMINLAPLSSRQESDRK